MLCQACHHMSAVRKLLIVEDEFLIRRFMQDLFEGEGWDVLQADCADEAIKHLSSCDVAAVVTDVEMPGSMDGIALSWFVHERCPDIRVLVMSGRVLPRRSEIPPTSHFLLKPIPADLLVQIVNEMSRAPPDPSVAGDRNEKTSN